MTAADLEPSFDFTAQRRAMVDCQVKTFDVTDHLVIARMLETPREVFLPERLWSLAYSDKAFDVSVAGAPRRLLSPMTLARMIQAAAIRPGDRMLDLAGGGGYGAAIVAPLCASTLAVEVDDSFTQRARAGFARIGLNSAHAETCPLTAIEGAFDVILVNGAVDELPVALSSLLNEGGRLVAIQRGAKDPTGFAACAVLWERSDNRFGRRSLFNAAAPVLPEFARAPAFSF